MDSIVITEFHPYQRAMVDGDDRITLPRHATKDLEEAIWLAMEADEDVKVGRDNKCTFKFFDSNHQERYITFYDFTTLIGTTISGPIWHEALPVRKCEVLVEFRET